MAALKQMIQSRDSGSEDRYSPATTDIDTLIRKVFDRPAAVPAPVEARSQSRRDPETAFDLLDRAAAAFDILLNRSQQLERQMQEADERARVEAAKQQKVGRRLEEAGLGHEGPCGGHGTALRGDENAIGGR